MSDTRDILEPDEQGLGDAVSMLDMINQVLGSFDNDIAPMRDDVSLEFPLEAAIRLLPRRYVKDFDMSIVKGETLLIKIDDLFDQLKTGKVAVPISTLAFHIPVNLVYSATFEDPTIIGLPIQLVVHSVGTHALISRVPTTERYYDIDGFSDPFPESMGSRSADVASDAPAVLLEGDEDEVIEELPGEAQTLDMGGPTFLSGPEPEPEQAPAQDTSVEPEPEPEEAPPITSFAYPVKDALHRLSNGVVRLPREIDPAMTIRVDIPDLFEQLKHGKVAAPTRELLKLLPPPIHISEHVLNAGEATSLSLKTVIKSLGVEILRARLTTPLRDFDIARMVDPFPEPEELHPPLPETRRASSHRMTNVQPSGVRHVAANIFPHHTMSAPTEQHYRELPGNININTAMEEELMLLEGIDSTIAAKIIKWRDKHGPFATIFDLLKVPGVEAPTVEQMSGMRVGAGLFNRRRRLASLLHIAPGQVADLKLVVEAVIQKPDFSGCVISDSNGLMLAQAGMDETAESIAAIVPRLLRRIHSDISLIRAGSPCTASITTSTMCLTVASHRAIAVSTIHRDKQINEADLAFVRKLVLELAWLISLHAYAGPGDE